MKTWTAGVDVGGTLAKLVLADERGRVAARSELPTQASSTPEAFLDRLAAALKALQAAGPRASSVGLAVAGLVDSRRGILRRSPNLPRWRDAALAAGLRRRLRLPVVMSNDADAAAWGIYAGELSRRPKNLFVITLGTGVGGGLVSDGRPFRGSFGSAGEIGHTTVVPDGERCACGNKGCLEAYSGGRSLVRRYLALKGLPPKTALDPLELDRLARRGDRAARRVWAESGRALALACADLACVLNPDTIVLAGGVSGSAGLFLPALKAGLAANPFKGPREGLRIRVSRLRQAGALGAALLAREGPR